MPWSIETRDGKHCVVLTATGEVKKCYPNRAAAAAYLKALYANTSEAKMSAVDRLVVKLAAQAEVVSLARVWIPPFDRERNGKIEQVDGYWRTLKPGERLTALEVKAIGDDPSTPQFKGLGGSAMKEQVQKQVSGLRMAKSHRAIAKADAPENPKWVAAQGFGKGSRRELQINRRTDEIAMLEERLWYVRDFEGREGRRRAAAFKARIALLLEEIRKLRAEED